MLKLENIKKVYKTKENSTKVLNNLSVTFKEKEFVSILGESGSGKSTLLNIIGGLDKDYEGNIYLNGENISNKNNSFYDRYRNGKIGFVFQEYNLIENLNVYKNVELNLLIRNNKIRKEKVLDILDKVGLLEFKNKKISELSGGQKQRVAIARALVTNPDILLLDEPTGALDSLTSIEIMELIKKMSFDKLVIMVTHNEKLAKEYSDRIITIKDGIVKDYINRNYICEVKPCDLIKVGLSFKNSFLLAFRNIKTKLFRNVLTILALIISIIGVSFVMAISLGFNKQVEFLKENTLADYPVAITSESVNEKTNNYDEGIYAYKIGNENSISKDFVNYINDYPKDRISGIVYNYEYKLKTMARNNKGYKLSDELPFVVMPNKNDYLENNYEILSGRLPKNNKEILLKVNEDNMISEDIFTFLGVDVKSKSFDYFIDKEIKVVNNNQLYKKENDMYYTQRIDKDLYYDKNNITLKIVGIIKSKRSTEFNTLINEEAGGFYIKNNLLEEIININSSSDIVNDQIKSKSNLLTGENLSSDDNTLLLNYLGNKQQPYLIYVYPGDYNNKEVLLDYLDKYSGDDINYIDVSLDVVDSVKTLVFGVTTILLVLSFLSLFISLILIAIITYTSSIERKKEIGILRSLGARKKDIRRLFVFETISLALVSSFISICLVKFLVEPINNVLKDVTQLDNLMVFSIDRIIIVVLISILTALFGSIIPALKASRRDPVECLR